MTNEKELLSLLRRMLVSGGDLSRRAYLMKLTQQHGRDVRDAVERLHRGRSRA